MDPAMESCTMGRLQGDLMNRIAFVTAASFALLSVLGCAGMTGMSGNPANKTACEGYVKAYNDLTCMGDSKLNADQMCLNQELNPMDMASYWDCMAEGMKCDDAIPNMAAQASCTMPTL